MRPHTLRRLLSPGAQARGHLRWRPLVLAALALGVLCTPIQAQLSPLNPTVDQGEAFAFSFTEGTCSDTPSSSGEWSYSTTGPSGGEFGSTGHWYQVANCVTMGLAAPYVPGTYQFTMLQGGEPVASTTITVNPIVITISGPQQLPQYAIGNYSATVTGIVPTENGVAWFVYPNTLMLTPNGSTVSVSSGGTAGTYDLVASSTWEPSVYQTFALTVLPPPVTTISPASAVTTAGVYVNFSASVINASNQNVLWYTNDPNGGVNATGNGSTASYFHRAGTPGGQFYVQAQSYQEGNQARAPVTVVTLAVLPAAITVLPGTAQQFAAELIASEQATQWSTTVPGATISNGLLQVPANAAAGTYTVQAETVGAPNATGIATVTIASTIPVTGVVVSPARSVIDSGQQEPFTAVVEGQNGEPHPNQAVTWSISGPASAAIAANGLFTAPAVPGVYIVTATSVADATQSGAATVTVGEDLMILPSSASLAPGASQTFAAQVSGVTTPAVTWSVEEGAAGGSISPAGVYIAPATPGVYHVIALSSSAGETVQGIATVVVGASPQIAVTVSPPEAAVAPGGMQAFTATVEGSADTTVVWSASAGTIDATGLFTAPSSYGTVTITAASHANPQVQASATAVISNPGGSQAFQYDANGNLLSDGMRTYEWDAENRLTAINFGTQRSEFAYDGLGRRALITELLNGALRSSRHYVYIGDQIVEETDATTAPASNPPSFGNFDSINCTQLVGWAWSSAQPSTPISVDVYDGSTKIASTLASAFRSDVRQAGAGNGNHGFYFPTPAALKTGAQHTVTVKLGGTTTSIGTQTVTCHTPDWGGWFDEADCTQLAGWVWDAYEPNSPINVDIYDGSTLIATQLAGTFRQDLLTAGAGNGDHGFYLPTPVSLKTGTTHAISIRPSGTTTQEGNTLSMSCPAPSYQGNFDSADCTQLVGWAWDANQPNAALNVDIYDGATLLATVEANTFRQDLLNASKGNGYHGFTFSSPSLYTGSTHSLSVTYSGTTILLGESPRSIACPSEDILARFWSGGMQYGGASYYFSYDHLGSIREVTDINGNVLARYDYDPYGRQIINQGAATEFGYGGYYYHQPSGLSLTKYRAYDPDLGRWDSRDPIGEIGGLNLYEYSRDDPSDLSDPQGLIPQPPASYPRPPGWNSSWQWRYPEGISKKCTPRWFDPEGGEWHWHGADRWHDTGHWDYNPWKTWNTKWQNLPVDGPAPAPTPEPSPVPWWRSLPDLVPDPLPVILNPCLFVPLLCLPEGKPIHA
jgi:RHS repeat-associated protein